MDGVILSRKTARDIKDNFFRASSRVMVFVGFLMGSGIKGSGLMGRGMGGESRLIKMEMNS